jgi:hypothetical protein
MLRVTRAFAVLMLSSILALPRPASAKERAVVQVFIAATPAERPLLGQVIRELLEPLPVEVKIESAARIDRRRVDSASAGASGEVAIAFIDTLEPGRSTLYLVDPQRDRIYERSVPRPRQGEELAREELGHILETAIEGLLVGETIGVPRKKASPPAVRPQSTPPRPTWQPAPEVGLFYEAQYLSHEVLLTHGPMLAGGLSLRRDKLSFGFLGTAQYRQPLHAESALVSARLEGAALRLLATAGTEIAPGLELCAGLGGGADVVDVEPESRDAARAEASESRVLSYGVFRGALGVGIRASRSFWLSAWLAADVDPSGTRYVFLTRVGEQNVLTPIAVRPAALLGLKFR